MVGGDVAASAGGSSMKWMLVFSGVLLISITAYGIYGPETDNSPKILDICVTHSDDINHYHPWLFIEINGQSVNIAENIGVTEDCMYPIHTHSGDGKLHIEIPKSNPMKIKVSDFFEVWGAEFNENQILDYSTDEDHEIIMTVFPSKADFDERTNGEISSDFENHVFSSVDLDGNNIADGDDTVVLIEYKQKEN